MLHNFLPSIKKDISYCSHCGCLSYKNIPSKSNISPNKNDNIIKLDPLAKRYKPISLKIDFSLTSHINYMKFRQKGLSKIYFLSKHFNIEKMIIHKGIGLMDQIYLNHNDIPIENIDIIASICLLISFEYNNCCGYAKENELNRNNYNNSLKNSNVNSMLYMINNIKGMSQYLIKEIKNIIYWQIFCLKKLNYNLGKYSAFDYLYLFFKLGIIFTKENIDILSIYNNCFNLLDILINNYNICKYNQYVLAMSIIYIIFNNNNYFNKKIFKYIYGVDFSKLKYMACIKEINDIINDIYHLQNFYIPLINYRNINNIINNINYIQSNDEYFKKNNKNIIFNNSLIKELFIQFINILENLNKHNYIYLTNNIQILNLFIEYFYPFLVSNAQIGQILQNLSKFELSKCKYISNNIKNEKIENPIAFK